jgi:hypothetical protein
MGRKKNQHFKLSPDWMFSQPIDFEYNKYTLLGYLQKCEKSFDNFEIYPDFVEISLHLANLQSLMKERTLLTTNKKFQFPDDEILLKELIPQRITGLTEDEFTEIEKTIMFSGNKLLDVFNVGKSIWSIVYESTDINLKKNKRYLNSGRGFVYLPIKESRKVLVWEYSLQKNRSTKGETRLNMDLIWEGDPQGLKIFDICLERNSWKDKEQVLKLPMFEVLTNNKFPMEETLIPMIKRKLVGYLLQVIPSKELRHFDSSKLFS